MGNKKQNTTCIKQKKSTGTNATDLLLFSGKQPRNS